MKNFYILLITISLLLLNLVPGKSQSSTMYYMGTVPQSYYLNPATQPGCNFYLGAPIVSPIQLEFSNTLINTSSFLFAGTDSVIHLLHPEANISDYLESLKDVEFGSTNYGLNLASFGFRVNDMYFSFDATIKTSLNTTYPKNFIEFLVQGNKNNATYDFTDLSTEALSYLEFGINISKNWNDQFSIGVRPKLLYGLAAISTDNSNLSIETSVEEWKLNAQMTTNIAVSGVEIPVDENGVFDSEEDINLDNSPFNETGYNNIMSANKGLGIDIGAHYSPIDDLQLSLSILDLGYINWKDKPYNLVMNGSYSYQGVDINAEDSLNWFDNQLDTMKSQLNMHGTNETFKTSLNPKIIAGGRLFITPGLDVGILSRTEFYKNKTTQDFVLLANLHPVKAFSFSASYSLLGNNHNTIGLGIGLKLLMFNMYIISDFVPMSYDKVYIEDQSFAIPLAVNSYRGSLRFGLNLVFGCNKAKKLSKDQPLFNSSNWLY